MAAWSRKTLKKSNFYVFWKKRPNGEIFKILFRKDSIFIASPIDALCSNFVKFGQREISKIVRCLCLPEKIACSSAIGLANARIAPKICHTMYSEFSRFHPNRFTFGGVISERVNTIKTGRKVFPIFAWSLASSRIVKECYLCCRFFITFGLKSGSKKA